MCRKRHFKKAVKKTNRDKQRSFEENDLVAAFNDADVSGDGRKCVYDFFWEKQNTLKQSTSDNVTREFSGFFCALHSIECRWHFF